MKSLSLWGIIAFVLAVLAPSWRVALLFGNGDVLSVKAWHALLAVLVLYGAWCVVAMVVRFFMVCRGWFRWRVRAVATTPQTVALAEQALQQGRTRRALRLLRGLSRSDINALRPVVQAHLYARRPDRALYALQEAVLYAPVAAHVGLFRKIRPFLTVNTLQKFRQALQLRTENAVIRRILALEALLEGRSDATVAQEIGAGAPPLVAELLRAAVRARQNNDNDAMLLLIQAALPADDTRDNDALASVVKTLYLPTSADTVAQPPRAPYSPIVEPHLGAAEDYAQT